MQQKRDTHFDLQRHLRQLLRDVLPIFLVVALIAAIVAVVFFPKRQKDGLIRAGVAEGELPRVSLLAAADQRERDELSIKEKTASPFDPAFVLARPIDQVRTPRAARFDAPMGSEHAALTYNAQPFLVSRHLGDDLNGIGGQDSDLGGPVYAVADGMVAFAGWASDGWGNVIVVLHKAPGDGRVIQSFYGHLEAMRVPVGEFVRRGQVIATVGKGDGRYLAHLHFEMRDFTVLSAGAGYADAALGRLPGEAFLSRERGAPDDWLSLPPQGVAPVIPDDDFSLEAKIIGDQAPMSESPTPIPTPTPTKAQAEPEPVAIPRPIGSEGDPIQSRKSEGKR